MRCFFQFGVSVKPSFHGGLLWVEGRPSRIGAMGPYRRAITISIFFDISYIFCGAMLVLSLCFINNMDTFIFPSYLISHTPYAVQIIEFDRHKHRDHDHCDINHGVVEINVVIFFYIYAMDLDLVHSLLRWSKLLHHS